MHALSSAARNGVRCRVGPASASLDATLVTVAETVVDEDFGFAWWPGETHGFDDDQFLLPVGRFRWARLDFDPTLWTADPPIPNRYPIAATVEVLDELVRHIFLDPTDGSVHHQQGLSTGPELDTMLMNSSVSTLVSSLALYQLWYPRIVCLEGATSTVISAMIGEGMRQMDNIEPAADHLEYWTHAISHLGRRL